MNSWLPAAGLKIAEAPMIEHYGPGFDGRTGNGGRPHAEVSVRRINDLPRLRRAVGRRVLTPRRERSLPQGIYFDSIVERPKLHVERL